METEQNKAGPGYLASRHRPGLAVEMVRIWGLCDASGGGLWRARLAGRQVAPSAADNGKVGGSSDGGLWKEGNKGEEELRRQLQLLEALNRPRSSRQRL